MTLLIPPNSLLYLPRRRGFFPLPALGRWLMGGLLCALLSACAHRAPAPVPTTDAALPADWSVFALPGKRPTHYSLKLVDGQPVVHATAASSASMLRRKLDLAPEQLGELAFSWQVSPEAWAAMHQADLRDREREDSPVRLVLAFDGDVSRLSARNRMLFDLAETLTGEAPPYATLMYVWCRHAALETVLPGGRTDRVRMIVVDSGPDQVGRWRLHQRQIVQDFERAFGEPPGRLIGLALMSDSDNTASRSEALYAWPRLLPPADPRPQ